MASDGQLLIIVVDALERRSWTVGEFRKESEVEKCEWVGLHVGNRFCDQETSKRSGKVGTICEQVVVGWSGFALRRVNRD